jgi:hypothetical protein
MNYLSWVDTGDKVLFHEYGHAWSGYYANLAQQDPSFSGYLQARGLAGDTRINSSYRWAVGEMIAEDYRQLFATPAAAAYPQMNQDIPRAADVAGLRDYLSSTFRQSVSAPAPAPAPAPAAAPVVKGLAMNPAPVKTTGTASFTTSTDAAVTVDILDSKGQVIRRLLNAAPKTAGSISTLWDRKTTSGAKAVRGTYTVAVRAESSAGVGTSAVAFSVS